MGFDVVEFLRTAGIPESHITEYHEIFTNNHITKNSLVHLDRAWVKDMNIRIVGHAISILTHAKKVCEEIERKDVVARPLDAETYSPPAKKRRSDESSTVKEFSLGVSELPKTEQLHNRFFLAANNKFSNPVEMAAAYWASTFLLPDFAALEKDFVELMDGTSLLVLRNRIDYLELLFLVQDLPLSKLLSDLNLSVSDIDQITTNVMTKIANHNKILGLSELSAVVAQEVIRTTQTSSTASQTPDPSMSKTISVKASIHYHRWKHAFQYPRHSGIAKIKTSLDDSGINYEDFFIEIAALFTVCSTAGVHLRLVAKCGVESIERSLMVYSMNQPITVGTVKSLYCSIP